MSSGPVSTAVLLAAALLASPLFNPRPSFRARLDLEELARAQELRADNEAAAAAAESAVKALVGRQEEEPAPEPPSPGCDTPPPCPAEPACRPCAPCLACPLPISVNLTEPCPAEAAWDTDRIPYSAALGRAGVSAALGAVAVAWGRRASPGPHLQRRPRDTREHGAGPSPSRTRLPRVDVFTL